jgi:hypothetical protein
MMTEFGIHVFVPEYRTQQYEYTKTRILVITNQSKMMNQTRKKIIRRRPSPEFGICRHKEPSLAIEVILITKEMDIFSFGKVYCFILPWECTPYFLPRKIKLKS